MYCAGLDIGFRNLKIVHGEAAPSRMPTELCRPSIACREEQLMLLDGARAYGDAFQVTLDGRPWAVGVPANRVQNHVQAIHQDRINEPEYKAIFYGALASIGRPVIDLLVTGLPVDQHADPKAVAHLTALMSGWHTIHTSADGHVRKVFVKKVQVVPQPVGAFVDACTRFPKLEERLTSQRVLVVDPGHYSVDYVVVNGGAIEDAHSGTSRSAGSVAIDAMAKFIHEKEGVDPPEDRLEDALRKGVNEIYVGRRTIDIRPARAAAAQALQASFTQMVSKLRSIGDRRGPLVDFVILAGGGSELMKEMIETFCRANGAELLASRDPVMTNARGFWYLGYPDDEAARNAAA